MKPFIVMLVIASSLAHSAMEASERSTLRRRVVALEGEVERRHLTDQYVERMHREYFGVMTVTDPPASQSTQFWKAMTAPDHVRLRVLETLLKLNSRQKHLNHERKKR
jgi:hypothetical protein